MFKALFALASVLGAMASPTGYSEYKKLPVERAMSSNMSAPTGTDILQYALTLEHLEATFYAEALAKYSADDFCNAGYPDWVRARFMQIAGHEMDHVNLLSSVLGSSANAACNYTFPYTDVTSFINLATVIESVGVSAYAGAAQYIVGAPAYLTAAASILSTESRHQAWEQSAALTGAPWSGPFDTPVGLDMIYTIAAQFITGCPSSNMALPVMAFPSLTLSKANGENPCAGYNATFTYTGSMNSTEPCYAVFYSGLGMTSVEIMDGSATVPSTLQGYVYVVVSSESNTTMVGTDNIVAGPALIDLGLSAYVNNTDNA
ncbi:ferritin-like domain-domain-containing protein [Kockovaella imperatae]|uniref:Ferritin-like domain-domain-containing protein n=1 Tax=Kockovaella imperatae TaxID=4999 RepID=A0A1Y1UQ18_9TREE|nr:ferritin-like domain-domain-containing protein [Kockovaella imperatae]ORX39235.1 ferritin-like domain-domain-containing protein [Kockovaella imperatae]